MEYQTYNGGIIMDNYPNSEWDNMIIIMGFWIIMIPFQQVSRTPALTIDQLFFFDTAHIGLNLGFTCYMGYTRMKPMDDSEQTILAILRHPRNMTLDAI